jgi:hypothetical protein
MEQISVCLFYNFLKLRNPKLMIRELTDGNKILEIALSPSASFLIQIALLRSTHELDVLVAEFRACFIID